MVTTKMIAAANNTLMNNGAIMLPANVLTQVYETMKAVEKQEEKLKEGEDKKFDYIKW